MNLYPGGREDQKGDTSFNLCLREGVVAIGWSRLNAHVRFNSAKRYFESARVVFSSVYHADESRLEKWEKAFGYLNEIEKDDLVWTKRSKGHYYIDRIMDFEARPLRGEVYTESDFGCGRKCEWNAVVDDLEVPAEVKRDTRGTIHPIKDPTGKALALSEQLYNELNGKEVYHPPELRGELFDFLAPEDVEDIVGIFLQVKKNLLIVPSTSKQSASPVEFLMINRKTGVEVGTQVKTGNQAIKPDAYANGPERIYFFQERGRPRDTLGKRGTLIQKDELARFVMNNPRLLPGSIRRLVRKLKSS